MICSSCSHENPDRARFCLECGTALAARCGGCGLELPTGAKFCMECGARVAGAAAPLRPVEAAGARKIVSILFADLVGSTGLHERLDPESARRHRVVLAGDVPVEPELQLSTRLRGGLPVRVESV